MLFDHIEEKLNEVKYFLNKLEVTHDEHARHVRSAMRRPFEGEGKSIAGAFQYNFSAYLSAHRATRYYITRVSGKVENTAQWRADIDRRPALDALHHLRDIDIHDQTLNMAMTTTVRMRPVPEIQFSDLRLHATSLAANKRLAKRPSALAYLTENSIVEIARDGVSELEEVILDGRERGYLKSQQLTF